MTIAVDPVGHSIDLLFNIFSFEFRFDQPAAIDMMWFCSK